MVELDAFFQNSLRSALDKNGVVAGPPVSAETIRRHTDVFPGALMGLW